jgi:hypothetical protein
MILQRKHRLPQIASVGGKDWSSFCNCNELLADATQMPFSSTPYTVLQRIWMKKTQEKKKQISTDCLSGW